VKLSLNNLLGLFDLYIDQCQKGDIKYELVNNFNIKLVSNWCITKFGKTFLNPAAKKDEGMLTKKQRVQNIPARRKNLLIDYN